MSLVNREEVRKRLEEKLVKVAEWQVQLVYEQMVAAAEDKLQERIAALHLVETIDACRADDFPDDLIRWDESDPYEK